jgi:uncharacterized membrane protein
MTRFRSIDKHLHGQRGNVFLLFALFLPVLVGFMALTIDIARLYLIKVELQNAADAAALAGALSVSGTPGSYNWSNVESDARKMAQSNGVNGSLIQQATIDMGYWDSSTPAAGWQNTYNLGYLPAVRVRIEFSSTKNNGPLIFFFAPIASSDNIPSVFSATAIAAQSASGHSRLVQ